MKAATKLPPYAASDIALADGKALVGNSGGVGTAVEPASMKVYNVRQYGAVGNNSTDDYTAVMAAITAACANGGGRIYFPGGSGKYVYLIGSRIVIPNDYTADPAVPHQVPLEFVGDGSYTNTSYLDTYSSNLATNGGTVLNLTYEKSGGGYNQPDAKIVTLGQGVLKFTDTTLEDRSGGTTAFILTTNTQIQPRCCFRGKVGQVATQDAIVCGGWRRFTGISTTANSATITSATSIFAATDVGQAVQIWGTDAKTADMPASLIPGGFMWGAIASVGVDGLTAELTQHAGSTATVVIEIAGGRPGIDVPANSSGAPFQGYGSIITQCTFDHIRRCLWARAWGNSIVFRGNNVTSNSGGGGHDGVVELDFGNQGVIIADNCVEGNNYGYIIKVTNASDVFSYGNSYWDASWTSHSPPGATYSWWFMGPTSARCVSIEALTQQPSDMPYVTGPQSAGLRYDDARKVQIHDTGSKFAGYLAAGADSLGGIAGKTWEAFVIADAHGYTNQHMASIGGIYNDTTWYTGCGIAFFVEHSGDVTDTGNTPTLAMVLDDLGNLKLPLGSIKYDVSPASTHTGTYDAGTATWTMPLKGAGYKKMLVYLNGLTTTNGVITFPTAFTQAPLVTSTGLTGTFTASTTTLSLLCTTQTGWIIVEGF
jgi:hypothetical protein